jgi:aspartyl-tRNA(Asn)/glutamyl-tRNA(Gln) amidotransferase subunit C
MMHGALFHAPSMPHHDLNIHRIAELARLKLTAEEAARHEANLARILDYMEVLEKHDLGEVLPTAHASPVYDVWRQDEPRECFTNAEALANAPRQREGQFLMPRVVEE